MIIVPAWAGINIFAVLILTMIYLSSHNSIDYQSPQPRIFFDMLLLNIVIIAADSLSRFNDPLLAIVCIAVLFPMYPVLAYFWFRYLASQIFPSEPPPRVWRWPMLGLLGFDLLFIVTSFFTGFAFRMTVNGYHRGSLYLLVIIIGFIMVGIAQIMLFTYRNRIEKQYFKSLLLFPVPPLIGAIIQYETQGFPFLPCGIAFSVIMVFLNIQNRLMDLDFLTGAYTRRRLHQRIADEIRAAEGNKTFAAIMIDLDKFKLINDTYGHIAGDKVLKKTVSLLKHCVRSRDFIARYGGDEFCVVLDVSTQAELDVVLNRIRTTFASPERRKDDSIQPFTISMGAAIYDPDRPMTVYQFQDYIDQIMYQHKHPAKIDKQRFYNKCWGKTDFHSSALPQFS